MSNVSCQHTDSTHLFTLKHMQIEFSGLCNIHVLIHHIGSFAILFTANRIAMHLIYAAVGFDLSYLRLAF
ncbi:hypothetical protein D3C86_1656810 [compost metagenome]